MLSQNEDVCEISKLKIIDGLYRYSIKIIISTDCKAFVHMGCKRYSLEYWKIEENFWNNTNEFPNDGSFETMRRRLALDFAIQTAEMMLEEMQDAN